MQSEQVNRKHYDINLNLYGSDFLKQLNVKTCKLSSALSVRNGFDISWVLSDLIQNYFSIIENDKTYFCYTPIFVYCISKTGYIRKILYNGDKVKKIIFIDSGIEIHTKYQRYTISDNYAIWLNYIHRNEEKLWYVDLYKGRKINGDIAPFIDNLAISPNLLYNCLKNSNLKEIDLISIVKNDLIYNGYVNNIDFTNLCLTIVGWRFIYILRGFVIIDILDLNSERVDTLEVDNNSLTVNNRSVTRLDICSPIGITDLSISNRLRLLSHNYVDNLEIQEHAQKRYKQRVNNKDYLFNIDYNIKKDLWESGVVVVGSHINKRRKVQTDSYVYILEENKVISIWPIRSNGVRKDSKKPKVSLAQRRLEYMSKIFTSIQ